MQSALKIITRQAKGLNAFKSKASKTKDTTQKVPKHMRKFPNFKYGKTQIIHYEKRIKNDVDIEKNLKGNMNLPVYKYRIDAKVEEVK